MFDFSRDRLIWDTGHQIYPHKLITGRYPQFGSIRTKGGLMGYPNPHESDYDLFMTGHAGCSVSTVSGLKALIMPSITRSPTSWCGFAPFGPEPTTVKWTSEWPCASSASARV